MTDVGGREVRPGDKMIVIDGSEEGAWDRAKRCCMYECKMIRKSSVMRLVRDDIELGISRCRRRWLESNGPKFVGSSFAGEDLVLIFVDMNLMFIEDDLAIIVT